MLRTRRRATVLAVLFGMIVALVVSVAGAPVSADDNSNCPPGQPSGRPPGNPPNQPGQPSGRPSAYPPGECNLRLSQGSVARGESVGVLGTGCSPEALVTLALEPGGKNLANTVANSDGAFSLSVRIPSDANLGRNEVKATCEARVLSASLVVTDPGGANRGATDQTAAAPSSGLLPATGAMIGVLSALGLGLVALGTSFVVAARRRRAAASA